MRHKLLIAAVLAGLVLIPGRADAACCQAMPGHAHEMSAIDMLLKLSADPQLTPAPPVRQLVEVWFTQPTLVGRSILQGRYVIEHDNDRMARGEPCTHIYAFSDRTKPVATFHCTHLERDRAGKNLVALVNDPLGFKRLTEFQFAGEDAAHGYPGER
ncbi:MAG: hypothetical protein RLZZ53_1139 [Acidobacteriota bacterium]|jgi:hypothetical protein